MKVVQLEGREYELKRVYECAFCGKKVVAGSKELLEEWTKFGTFDPYGAGSSIDGHMCGSCAGKERGR